MEGNESLKFVGKGGGREADIFMECTVRKKGAYHPSPSPLFLLWEDGEGVRRKKIIEDNYPYTLQFSPCVNDVKKLGTWGVEPISIVPTNCHRVSIIYNFSP